ncbi:MAG: cation transporter [Hyphomicrobiaceae bacterium]
MTTTSAAIDYALRRTLVVVILINLVGFAIEFGFGSIIGSVSLFADSVDFLEDAGLNLLVLFALGWSIAARRRLGIMLAGLILLPAAAALWVAMQRVFSVFGLEGIFAIPGLASDATQPPAAGLLTLVGVVALILNAGAAFALARVRRRGGGSLMRAAYLSARNDVLSNIAIIVAGLMTAVTVSIWPDLVVGLFIIAINAGASREVYLAACNEKDHDEKTDAAS